jgi:drug/metabolite transporter (DMT)-like permease
VTSTAPQTTRRVGTRGYAGGLGLGLISALSFGLSGSLARSLLDMGWSPAAVVATRAAGAFLILLIPSLVLLRRIGLPTGRQFVRLLAYGVVAVALVQLCYFSAVQYLSVGVALLLGYLGGVTILADTAVGWWLPVSLLIFISSILAYLTGIAAVRRLGSSFGSFVALIEVIFAIGFCLPAARTASRLDAADRCRLDLGWDRFGTAPPALCQQPALTQYVV